MNKKELIEALADHDDADEVVVLVDHRFLQGRDMSDSKVLGTMLPVTVLQGMTSPRNQSDRVPMAVLHVTNKWSSETPDDTWFERQYEAARKACENEDGIVPPGPLWTVADLLRLFAEVRNRDFYEREGATARHRVARAYYGLAMTHLDAAVEHLELCQVMDDLGESILPTVPGSKIK